MQEIIESIQTNNPGILAKKNHGARHAFYGRKGEG